MTIRARMCEVDTRDCCYEWKLSTDVGRLCEHTTWTDYMDGLEETFLRAAHSPRGCQLLTHLRMDSISAMDNTTHEVLVYWGTRLLRNLNAALGRDRHCAILCLRRVTPALPYDVIRYIVYGYLRPDQRARIVRYWEFIVNFPTHPHARFDMGLTDLIIKELGWH